MELQEIWSLYLRLVLTPVQVFLILLTGSPAKLGHVLLYSTGLFGMILFSMQDTLVNNKQTRLLKHNFSDTITPIDKSYTLYVVV